LWTIRITTKPERSVLGGEDAMNWSLYTADRLTHLKIMVVGLSAALLLSIIAVAATTANLGADSLNAQGLTVIKAGAPTAFSERNDVITR
jgi:hypothetical protein